MKKQFKSLLLVICLVLSVLFVAGCKTTTEPVTEPTTQSSETTESSQTTESTSHTHEFTGEFQSDATGHWQVCSCNETNKEEHTFGEYVSNGNATHTADGTKSRECSVCHYIDTIADTGTAKGHDKDLTWSIDSTTGECYQTCSCGEVLNKGAHVYTSTNEDGTKTITKTVTKWPTATEDGEITYVCQKCGDTHKETLKLYSVAQASQITTASETVILIKGIVLGSSTTVSATELLLKDEATNTIIAIRDVGSTKVGSSNALLLGNAETPIVKGDLVQVLAYAKEVTAASYIEKGKIFFNSVVESYGETWASTNIMLEHGKSTALDRSDSGIITITNQDELKAAFGKTNFVANTYKIVKLSGTIYAIQYTTDGQKKESKPEQLNFNRFFFDSTISTLNNQKIDGASPSFKDNNTLMMTGKTAAMLLFGKDDIDTSYSKKSSFTGEVYCICIGGTDVYESFVILNLEDVIYSEVKSDETNHWRLDASGAKVGEEAHNWTLTETVDPTCTEDGHKSYSCACGKTKSETLDKTGHDQPGSETQYTYELVEGAHKHYYTCHCTEKIYADCSFNDYQSNQDATCFEDGTKSRTCSICGHVETVADAGSKLEHNYGEEHPAVTAVEGTNGNVAYYQCSKCNHYFVKEGETYVDTEWSAIVTIYNHTCACKEGGHHEVEPATCLAAGVCEYYECECGKKYSDSACTNEIKNTEITKLDHQYVKHDAKAATCTEDGNIEYYTCPNGCGKNYVLVGENYSVYEDSIVTTKTGHDEAPTEASKYTHELVGDVHKHYYTCHCDEKIYANCTFGDWSEKTAATCGVNRVEKRTCSVCGYIEEKTIADTALTHSYDAYSIELVTDASTLKAGDTIIFVSVDNRSFTTDKSSAALKMDGSVILPTSGLTAFTLASGASGDKYAGSFSFVFPTGTYIGGNSSATNGLGSGSKSFDTSKGNTSWTITIDSTTHVASIVCCNTAATQKAIYIVYDSAKQAFRRLEANNPNILIYKYSLGSYNAYEKAATCEADGAVPYYTCKNCGKKYWNADGTDLTNYVVEKLGHNYVETWTWAEDNSYATLSVVCENNEYHKLVDSVKVFAVESTTATCTAAGTKTYTVKYQYKDGDTVKTAVATKSVDEEALGHKYSRKAYTYTAIEKTATYNASTTYYVLIDGSYYGCVKIGALDANTDYYSMTSETVYTLEGNDSLRGITLTVNEAGSEHYGKLTYHCLCCNTEIAKDVNIDQLTVDQAKSITTETPDTYFFVKGVVVGIVHTASNAELLIQNPTSGEVIGVRSFATGVIYQSPNFIDTYFKPGYEVNIPVSTMVSTATGVDSGKVCLEAQLNMLGITPEGCKVSEGKSFGISDEMKSAATVIDSQADLEAFLTKTVSDETVTNTENIYKVVKLSGTLFIKCGSTKSNTDRLEFSFDKENSKVNNLTPAFRVNNTKNICGTCISNILLKTDWSDLSTTRKYVFKGDVYCLFFGGNGYYYQFVVLSASDATDGEGAVVESVVFDKFENDSYEAGFKTGVSPFATLKATVNYYHGNVYAEPSEVSLSLTTNVTGTLGTEENTTYTLTATVEGVSQEYKVTIVGKIITLTAPTTTTVYYTSLTDKTGLILKADASTDIKFTCTEDGTPSQITLTAEMLSYDGELALGSKTFTISYESKTVSWTVNLVPNTYYRKLTSSDSLAVGDKLIIVNSSITKAAVADTNTSAGCSVVTNTEKTEVYSFGNASLFELESSTHVDNSFYLKTSISGTTTYLYTGSKTATPATTDGAGGSTKKSANASYKITVDENGYSIIEGQGATTTKYVTYVGSKFVRNTENVKSIYVFVEDQHIPTN